MAEQTEIQKKVRAELLGETYVEPAVEEKKEEPKTEPVVEEKKIEEPIKQPNELSDAELIELLNKRNINVSSLDDLKPQETEEQKQAKAAKRKNDVLAYGLQTGKVKKEDYDALTKAESDKLSVVLSDVKKVLREKNPDLSETELKNKIDEYTLSDLEDDDILKIQRQRELLDYADLKLKNQYSSIYNLENEYTQYEQAEQAKYQLQRKVEAALPVYKKDVETAVNELRKKEFIIEDKENPENNYTVQFEYTEDDIQELKNAYFSGDQALSKIKNGYTLESIKQEGEIFLLAKKINAMINHSAKSYNSAQKDKYLRGTKGLSPSKDFANVSTNESSKNLNDRVKSDLMGIPQPKN